MKTDIAQDTEIDLVVSSIRVDKHASSIIPSIKAGKDVFVEWPLEANLMKARELQDLAKTHNVRTVVCAQGGVSMGSRKLQALLNLGIIGKVRSANVQAQTPWGGSSLPGNVDYFADKEVGGNIFTICFGHFMEVITSGMTRLAFSTILIFRTAQFEMHLRIAADNLSHSLGTSRATQELAC